LQVDIAILIVNIIAMYQHLSWVMVLWRVWFLKLYIVLLFMRHNHRTRQYIKWRLS